MAITYEPIATTTLSTLTATVTFSSISGNYTDLVLIVNAGNSNTISYIGIRFNSDTNSNYSSTRLYGDGSSATSDRYTNVTSARIGTINQSGSSLNRFNIMNYSNTTTYKTFLNRDDGTASRTGALVGLWRSTSAITSIDLIAPDSTGFPSGSTFTLYGIKSA